MKYRNKLGIGSTLLLSLLTLSPALPAGAEHFDILLKAVSGNSQVEAAADTTPPIGGVNPRPVLHIKVGEFVKLSWQMKNVFPHDLQRGVTVHFFVVKEDKLGQKPVPNPSGKSGILDNSFTMDFSEKASASGSVRLKLSEAGNYLVRLQSEETHEAHDHEHFSAIDIEVKN